MTATTELLAKLDAWLRQQPEWLALMAGGRRDRRRAAQLLSQHVFTLPVRSDQPAITRGQEKKLIRVFTQEMSHRKVNRSKHAQRDLNKAAAQRRRYQRLSKKRLEVLAARELARQAMEARESFGPEANFYAVDDMSQDTPGLDKLMNEPSVLERQDDLDLEGEDPWEKNDADGYDLEEEE